MKIQYIIFILGLCFLVSCTKDKVTLPDGQQNSKLNKVCLLQLKGYSYAFEGGKEFIFENSNTFTLSTTYKSPGDFGWVRMHYAELNELIFDGSIIWMGDGKKNFPELDSISLFNLSNDSLPQPDDSLFLRTVLGPSNQTSYVADVDSQIIADVWNSISNLEIVAEYRASNPGSKIHLLYYKPSDLTYWNTKWYVVLKN